MRLLKRAFDVLVSGAGLVASAPLWVVIGALIKIEDGGPVFFTQERVGRHGRAFTAFKFRSMVPDPAPLLRQASAGDPRITRVGAWLRATALDELPQLWNILRGDMSLVGPRPLAHGEIEVRGDGQHVALDTIRGYSDRHAVRPGLTGLTQVFAPRDITRQRKFRLDLIYVRRASLWLDLRLIVLSFWITFRGRWEHRGSKL